jgi:hypothetical protein
LKNKTEWISAIKNLREEKEKKWALQSHKKY